MSNTVTAVTPTEPGSRPDTTVGDVRASVDASLPPTVTNPVRESPGVLELIVCEAAATLHTSRYRLVTALAAYDKTGHWAFTGAHTCARWALGHDTGDQHDERERRDTHVGFRVEPDGTPPCVRSVSSTNNNHTAKPATRRCRVGQLRITRWRTPDP